MYRKSIAIMTVAAAMLGAAQSHAAILYGQVGNNGNLYQIDTVAQTTTFVGTDSRLGPEIEFSPDGSTIYSAQVGFASPDPSALKSVNPADGLTTATLALTGYPNTANGTSNTLTGLEFVGPTLYGAASRAGPETNPGVLVTVNLTSGALASVGTLTGMTSAAGGMDFFNGIMYAINSGDSVGGQLYSIDTGSGAATLIADLLIGDLGTNAVSGLANAGGVMYAIRSGFDNNLYSVNLATGVMTSLFDLGVNLNALTAQSVPEPAALGLFGLGLAAFGLAARRRKAA
jgi:hypothetical protein